MTKILVTGSKGQLGSELQKLAPGHPEHTFVFTDQEEMDITVPSAVEALFAREKPGVVIHGAAYTAVDRAEEDMDAARQVNVRGTANVASAASKVRALMVHISTDYVFDGSGCRPYRETDPASPASVYGKTKLDGELEVILNTTRSLIIRTSWLYSTYGHNFVKTILRRAREKGYLEVVFDQVGCPTYAADLAEAILQIFPAAPGDARGAIYHYSNEGVCSWYDFALAITSMAGISCDIEPVLSSAFKTAASRPHYSVMDKTRIKADFGLSVPYWRDSLARCLDQMD